MITKRRNLMKLGMAVGVAVATVAVITTPASSAARLSSMKAFSEDPTSFGSLASCSNIFTGPVTGEMQRGSKITADVSSFSCGDGSAVAANALPWKLSLQRDISYTISGVDVNITTAQGTCRYTGSLNGVGDNGVGAGDHFPDVYDVRGTLNRQSGDCGGDDQINVSNLIEVISFS